MAAERAQCDADKAGIGGCPAPVAWMIKAADMRAYACGRHLNRVCLIISRKGAEYMTVSVRENHETAVTAGED